MKHAYLVYYAHKAPNVIVTHGIDGIKIELSEEEFSQIVKIELIPYDVL